MPYTQSLAEIHPVFFSALPAELGGAVVTQQLTFAPDETIMCVNFTVMDDTIALEPNVSVILDLTLVTIKPGVVIGSPSMTTVIVVDDDGTYVWCSVTLIFCFLL